MVQAADAIITTKALLDISWDTLVVCCEVFFPFPIASFHFPSGQDRTRACKEG